MRYFAMIRWFLPRIRDRSAARAGARAMVSGQVVDTITNIKTVKLFAHDDHEDRAALGAMGNFRETALDFGYLSAASGSALMSLAGLLPVLLLGWTLILWKRACHDRATSSPPVPIAIRIAQMTGWVSFTLMAIYSNIGEIEDGMHTLTPRNADRKRRDARDLDVPQGEIAYKDLALPTVATWAGFRA